ncbi:thiolase C-terminal domain-containing protein [Naumannella cuiyingiana]|uniref:Acetyl-CoA acetyltransferase n=1 Tax=Naumannella cuiyingiana TaxID=1347891 RepID=A0A7Z0D6U3_9ACTN|nr:thiolase [Naumannella cuiyingiana]NYI69811.1 acetyl-CoA acetyltransferase [Naumannella cuiyingiana]
MTVAIIGAAETERLGKNPDQSTLGLHLEAAHNALADAGLTINDIDGVASVALPGPLTVANALGINPRWLDTTNVGGTSFLFHVRHAASAIAAGYCDTVLITHGESGRSRVGNAAWQVDPFSMPGQFEAPYGTFGPPTTFTVPARRFLADTGTTRDQMATVPVIQRQWAALNPRAMFRDPITVEDVYASKMIADPFHLLECCLVTDGGGALIITSAERAKDLSDKHKPVYLLGSGEACDAPMVSQMEDLTSSRGFRQSSAAAFESAGLTTDDVDHLMIYDAFAHVPLYGLEDMGFVGRGEAGAFIADGNTAPGGKLPLNTNGGGLSYTHTGMYGMFLIQESVRQLRGEAPAQVEGANVSALLGNGGMFMASATLILGTEDALSGSAARG